MYNLGNIINKEHYFFLENFGHVCELPDVAESKDGNGFVSAYIRVYLAKLAQILCDNKRTCFSKAKHQESSNLGDGFVENLGFILIFLLLSNALRLYGILLCTREEYDLERVHCHPIKFLHDGF